MGRRLSYLPVAFLLWILLSTPLNSSFVGFPTQARELDHDLSATRETTGTSSNTRSSASWLSNLDFRKKAECTSSVSSLLATASLSTTCAERIIGGNNDGSVHFSTCINYTVIPHATTAVKLTTDPYDQFCCGLCTIQYPQAVLFHWPVQRTNTWCDQIRSILKKEGVAYGGANYPQPEIDPSIYQNAMGLDPEIGGADAFDNDGNLRGPYTRPPQSGAYAVGQDGFVFVSPSVYVVFPIVLATNNCGVVGNAYTSWTLGVPEHQLSTYQEFYGTKAFDPADLGCPHSLEGRDLNDPGLTEAAEGMDPSVLLPAALTDLDPAWKSCSLLPLGLGRDPPRTLEPAKNMVPGATSSRATSTATKSVPYPQSLPKLSRPDPTSSSPPVEDRPLSAPKDAVDVAPARLQELPSVCSPFHRSRTDLSASAESAPPQPGGPGFPSQRPGIGPRNEAASTAERRTTAGPPIAGAAYVSATSYAAYVSNIYAWASDMDSEASVMRIPPVAPNNPYMALPKYRSRKRIHSSTMTESRFSPNSSRSQATSEAEASTSLEKLPLLSASYQSTPSPRSANAPANVMGVPSPQSISPALSEPNPTDNEKARYGGCGEDAVVNVAITTHDASTVSSSFSQISGESASLARLPTQNVSSLNLNDTSVPASKSSSIKTLGRGLSTTVIPQASVSSYNSIVVSMTGLLALTPSSGSAGGPGMFTAGSDGLWWIGLGFTIFGLLIRV